MIKTEQQRKAGGRGESTGNIKKLNLKQEADKLTEKKDVGK